MKKFALSILVAFVCFSPNIFAQDEVGTYQLHSINKGQGEVALYRINTKTGEVSEFADRIEVKSDSKPHLDPLFEMAKAQNKVVYSYPYWKKTTEESDHEELAGKQMYYLRNR